jgi:pimeloyl-ACP methyl ester carboxylesterase
MNSAIYRVIGLPWRLRCTHRSFAIILALFLSGSMPNLRAQNTTASQACSAIAAGFLGCVLADNPVDCAWLEGLAQTCTADTNSLPPPPPAPPSPSTPCSQPILLEARPGPVSRSKTTMAPRDQSASVPCIVLIDPVPYLVNSAGTGVVQDPETLAAAMTLVTGVGADSASRLVVQIYANSPGDQVKLSLQVAPSDTLGLPPLGMLQTILPADGNNSGSQITVTAVGTSNGTMAFALYVPPPDFSRGSSDDTSPSRSVVLTATSSATGLNCTQNITIWRPPIVLVHGIWSGPTTWRAISTNLRSGPPSQLSLFWNPIRYNQSLQGEIVSSIPQYGSLGEATAASLGFAFNAPTVDMEIRNTVAAFKQYRNAAAVQADLIAHSMGGMVVRTLENNPAFSPDWPTFDSGAIHKLITIDTPHMGSPLASLLLGDPSSCVRSLLALRGSYSFQTATLNIAGTLPVSSPQNGAVGDLVPGSVAIGYVQQQSNSGSSVPTAMISGQMTDNANGLSGLSLGHLAKGICSFQNDPLAQYFTPTGWPMMLGGDSDALVPVVSQQNGQSTDPPLVGVIHTDQFERLGFSGPAVLRIDQQVQQGLQPNVMTPILNYLNAASSSTCSSSSGCVAPFYVLP